ncbi:hypothetical protein [Bacillus sp. AFS073361]|nr:hypothetical protein [Bacillus sp. AFS073361]
MKDDRKGSIKIVSNDAIKGKPYLDIDRVITEGEAKKRVNPPLR